MFNKKTIKILKAKVKEINENQMPIYQYLAEYQVEEIKKLKQQLRQNQTDKIPTKDEIEIDNEYIVLDKDGKLIFKIKILAITKTSIRIHDMDTWDSEPQRYSWEQFFNRYDIIEVINKKT